MKSKHKRSRGPATGGRARGVVLEGRVRDVTDAGDAVVETSDGIVLVTGGLPDEQVRVRVEGSRAGVLQGSLLAVVAASPARVPSACEVAERCGGCPLMNLAIEEQRALKARRVARAVDGLAEQPLHVAFESAGSALGYRRRARLAFRKRGDGLVVGYRVHGHNRLVDVRSCPVLTAPLQTALCHVREALTALEGAGEIELDGSMGASLDRVHVAVRCERAVPPAAYDAAQRLAARRPIVSVALSVGGGAPALYGDTSAARSDHDGTLLWANVHGFSQANAAINVRLQELVLALAEPEGQRVIELYAGHGNFTLGLAERAAKLLAVEGDASAVQACRSNLRLRERTRAQVLCCDVRALQLRDRYDVLVLDPPRGGCPNVAELVQQARPRSVVYVSCHMTTLKRDLRALHSVGYRADSVHALDMFPQTGHVEAVVRMPKVVS